MIDKNKIIRTIHAAENEIVEVHWFCKDKSVLVQRYTVPPYETRKARLEETVEKEKISANINS